MKESWWRIADDVFCFVIGVIAASLIALLLALHAQPALGLMVKAENTRHILDSPGEREVLGILRSEVVVYHGQPTIFVWVACDHSAQQMGQLVNNVPIVTVYQPTMPESLPAACTPRP